MKIVAFCINPLFPDLVMGGATKHIQSITRYLGELGHEVTVLSTRRADTTERFGWHDNVQVLPILRFHQPFPQPYAAPAYDLAAILQDVGEYLEGADRFYMHDGEFLFPYAYQHVPTVVSLRDNVYPETLQGGFLFQGDHLVLISEYARQYFLQTAGRFFPDYEKRTVVIHNGVDWEHFKPTEPGKILDLIPIQPGAYPIVLHPHRPEATKGIRETIAVVDLLVHHYGFRDLKTLVPKWLDLTFSPELRAFYDDIQSEIARRGLVENFIFHGWVPQSLMPEYYSLGSVTLALGSFVESFGNSVYESLGCGTPSIPVRISSHREILPETLIEKVDFGDIETAARIAAAVIREKRRTSPETLAYLREHYSVEKQRAAYADVILNARRQGELKYKLSPIGDQTRFILPVWCYPSARGIYHDFRSDYLQSEAFSGLLAAFPQGFTFAEAQTQGIGRYDILNWYREGYLVPIPKTDF
jgi:glycosyltransferase involved in cell wall biosynthesis